MAEPRVKPPGRRSRKAGTPVQPSLRFHRKNLYLLALATASLVFGYVLLAAGNTHFAALLLVAGYLVLFPVALLIK